MRRACIGLLVLGTATPCLFGSESVSRVCSVQVTMSTGTPIPERLQLKVFSGDQRIAELIVPSSGKIALPPLLPGDYRIQTGSKGSNFFSSGRLRVPGSGPCETAISLVGWANQKNQIVDDDVDVEDLRVSPKARAEFEKGFAALERGEFKEAKKEFLEVTTLAPRLSRAYNVLGVISDQTGDPAAARKYFEKAIELNPQSKAALLNLVKLSMLEKQYERALAFLERYRAGTRDTAEVHGIAAHAYLSLGKYREAIEEAHAAHSLPHTNWETVHAIAATAYEALHQPEMAAVEYSQYMDETSNPTTRTQVARKIRELEAMAQPATTPSPAINSLLPQH